jgi:glycosyltransferase involved in cell wall biosynthesis
MDNSKKQRVIFYGIKDYPSRGGTSRVAENIIKNLRDEFDITVYCYKHPLADDNISGVKVVQFSERKIKGLGVFLYFLFSSLHILFFQKKGAIVHAHKTDCAFFVPLLRIKFKVILTSHEAPYKRDKWGVIGKTYFKLMELIFIKSGALLTSISKPLADYYLNKYKKQVIYIPNGIDLNNDRNKEEAFSVLSKYNVDNNFILFAARRLMYSKGIHTFLEAARNITCKYDFIYAGEIYHCPQPLLEMLEKSKAEGIKHIGFIEKLDVLLSIVEKSHLFVFPSETEGMSIMLLEVVSTQTPVICSDIPENTAVFNEEEVLYFKNKDNKDLQEKIEWALANPDLMQNKAALALERVKNSYSWSSISKQYEKLYKQICLS